MRDRHLVAPHFVVVQVLVIGRQLLGLSGSIILFVGVFLPIVSLPFVGSMNYFQNGRGDGTILLVLALASVALTLTKRLKALWVTGSLSLGVLIFTFVVLQGRISEAKSQLQSQLADNPFRGIAELAMQSVQLQWGWAVLVLGSCCLLLAAGMPERTLQGLAPGSNVAGVSITDASGQPLRSRLRTVLLLSLSLAGIIALIVALKYQAPAPINVQRPTLPLPPTRSTDLPTQLPAADKWIASEGKSSMDDTRTVSLHLSADSEIQGWLETTRPSLVIRCKERTTDLYVVTGVSASVEYGSEGHSVRVRVGDAPALRQKWFESTDNKALFAPNPIGMAKALRNAQSFLFEFTPFQASPATVHFDVRGLDKHLDQVAQACGW